MLKVVKGLAWMRDVTQVLVLDRVSAERKRTSELASTACRSLRFRARAKIRPLPWTELFRELGVAEVKEVLIPGPGTELGEVGSAEYYQTLATLAKTLQPKTIFEFGTYLGVSAYTMALNSPPDCRIYTVDLPDAALPGMVPGLNRQDQNHVTKSRFRVGEAFLRSSRRHQVIQIREDSMTFHAEQCATNVDLVFVDGGHSLPVITKDTENAFRILSPNGAILWDDYFHLYPDVVTYLDDLAEQYPLHGIPGTNFVLYSRRWHAAAHP